MTTVPFLMITKKQEKQKITKTVLFLYTGVYGLWTTSLGHIDEALQGSRHPGLLPLHKHHPAVDVDDDAAEGV